MTARYETRAVAAAAYPQGHWKDDHPVFLTHTADTETKQPLCKRVRYDSLLDDSYAQAPEEPPTCKTCLRRDPRYRGAA